MLANNAPESSRSIAHIGALELFDLGPSTQECMRYVRIPLGIVQKPFMTACMLPLMIFGIAGLLWTRSARRLLLLLLVPAYYVVFQSAMHTERRYVIAIHYFVLMLVAVAVYLINNLIVALLEFIKQRSTAVLPSFWVL